MKFSQAYLQKNADTGDGSWVFSYKEFNKLRRSLNFASKEQAENYRQSLIDSGYVGVGGVEWVDEPAETAVAVKNANIIEDILNHAQELGLTVVVSPMGGGDTDCPVCEGRSPDCDYTPDDNEEKYKGKIKKLEDRTDPDDIKEKKEEAEATAPADMAADIGEDISGLNDKVHSEGKNPPNPRKKKKKKEEILTNIKTVKTAVNIVLPPVFQKVINSILERLEEVEKSVQVINTQGAKTTVLDKYITAVTSKETIHTAIQKLEEVRQLIRHAEQSEIDTTVRSHLLKFDHEIIDLMTNIEFLSANHIK